jgi:hypothetical protein
LTPQQHQAHEEKNRIAVAVMAMDILENPEGYTEDDLRYARQILDELQPRQEVNPVKPCCEYRPPKQGAPRMGEMALAVIFLAGALAIAAGCCWLAVIGFQAAVRVAR